MIKCFDNINLWYKLRFITIKLRSKNMRTFISYSRNNYIHLVRLKSHLHHLTSEQSIDDWTDNEIEAGRDINNEIEQKMKEAKLILLLVSPDFIKSPFCTKEFNLAKECEKNNSARVIPILVEPCEKQLMHEFTNKNKWLPKNGEAVSNWPNADVAWKEIAYELKNIIIVEGKNFETTAEEIQEESRITKKGLVDKSAAGHTLEIVDMVTKIALILNGKEEAIAKEIEICQSDFKTGQDELQTGVNGLVTGYTELKAGQDELQTGVNGLVTGFILQN